MDCVDVVRAASADARVVADHMDLAEGLKSLFRGLQERRTMGLPNLLTVARANLPAAAARLGSAVPVLALATDFVDGKLAG